MASLFMHALAIYNLFALCTSFLYSHLISTRFFVDDYAMAVGYDASTDTFLFAGGTNNNQQLVTLQGKSFTDEGQTYLPQATHGYGTHYAQINDELWILNDDGESFTVVYTSKPYKATIPPITIPVNVVHGAGFDGSACLAMTEKHIFIVGGSYTNATQIYDIENGDWLSNVPLLPHDRMNAGCLIINHILYAVGGVRHNTNDEHIIVKSVLSLDISNMNAISSQEWTHFSSLIMGSGSVKAVSYGTDIIVIGIQDWNQSITVSEDIYVINKKGICSLQGSLEVATSQAALIVHESNHTLYVFGGYLTTDQWQYIPLPALSSNTQHNTNATDVAVPGAIVFVIVIVVGFVIALYHRYCRQEREEKNMIENMTNMARVQSGSCNKEQMQAQTEPDNAPKNDAHEVELEEAEAPKGEESSTFSNESSRVPEGPKKTMEDDDDAHSDDDVLNDDVYNDDATEEGIVDADTAGNQPKDIDGTSENS